MSTNSETANHTILDIVTKTIEMLFKLLEKITKFCRFVRGVCSLLYSGISSFTHSSSISSFSTTRLGSIECSITGIQLPRSSTVIESTSQFGLSHIPRLDISQETCTKHLIEHQTDKSFHDWPFQYRTFRPRGEVELEGETEHLLVDKLEEIEAALQEVWAWKDQRSKIRYLDFISDLVGSAEDMGIVLFESTHSRQSR